MIIYTATCKNLTALAYVLIRERIPFEFKPTRAYGHNHHRNGYGNSVIEFTIEESTKRDCYTLADLIDKLRERDEMAYGLSIINEFHY